MLQCGVSSAVPAQANPERDGVHSNCNAFAAKEAKGGIAFSVWCWHLCLTYFIFISFPAHTPGALCCGPPDTSILNTIRACVSFTASCSLTQVRFAVDRNTDLALFGGRCEVLARYDVGFDDEGHIQAVDMVCVTQVGGKSECACWCVTV